MAWVKFNSLDSFNQWHEQIKTQLKLPKPSINEAGEIVEDAIISTNYTEPFIVSNVDIRCQVEDEFLQGLELSQSPITYSNYENF